MTLIIIAAIITIGWGIAHLIPTKNVVKGFGDISVDNKRIITMEWIIEGLTLIFIGGLLLITVLSGGNSAGLGKNIYFPVAVLLIAMAIVSMFTGAKVKFIPFKLCPVLFTISAILLIFGALI